MCVWIVNSIRTASAQCSCQTWRTCKAREMSCAPNKQLEIKTKMKNVFGLRNFKVGETNKSLPVWQKWNLKEDKIVIIIIIRLHHHHHPHRSLGQWNRSSNLCDEKNLVWQTRWQKVTLKTAHTRTCTYHQHWAGCVMKVIWKTMSFIDTHTQSSEFQSLDH